MKLNHDDLNRELAGTIPAGKRGGRGPCRKVPAQIRAAKNAIFAESFDALPAQERLLRLALNEAEALAWQTAYPQLVFPALAAEKVQAVITWDRRQQARLRAEPVSNPAAGPAAYANN